MLHDRDFSLLEEVDVDDKVISTAWHRKSLVAGQNEQTKILGKMQEHCESLSKGNSFMQSDIQAAATAVQNAKQAEASVQAELTENKRLVQQLQAEVQSLKDQVAAASNSQILPQAMAQAMAFETLEPYKDGIYTYFSTTVENESLFDTKTQVVTKEAVPKLLNLFGFPPTLKDQAKVQIKTAKDSKYSCAPFSTYEDEKMMFCVYIADQNAAKHTVHYIGKLKPPKSNLVQEKKYPATFHGKL